MDPNSSWAQNGCLEKGFLRHTEYAIGVCLKIQLGSSYPMPPLQWTYGDLTIPQNPLVYQTAYCYLLGLV